MIKRFGVKAKEIWRTLKVIRSVKYKNAEALGFTKASA